MTIEGMGGEIVFTAHDGRKVKMDDVLLVRQSSANNASGAGQPSGVDAVQLYLGKEVLAGSDLLTTDGNKDIELTYTLPEDAVNATLRILDSDGNEVAIHSVDQNKGTNKFVWDSTDANGDAVDPGTYAFEVSAANDKGDDLSANINTYTYGRVTEVQGADTGATLILADGRTVNSLSVVSVREAASN